MRGVVKGIITVSESYGVFELVLAKDKRENKKNRLNIGKNLIEDKDTNDILNETYSKGFWDMFWYGGKKENTHCIRERSSYSRGNSYHLSDFNNFQLKLKL